MDPFLHHLKNWPIWYVTWTANFLFRLSKFLLKYNLFCWNSFEKIINLEFPFTKIKSSSIYKIRFILHSLNCYDRENYIFIYLLQSSIGHSYNKMILFDWNICQRLPSNTSALKRTQKTLLYLRWLFTSNYWKQYLLSWRSSYQDTLEPLKYTICQKLRFCHTLFIQ